MFTSHSDFWVSTLGANIKKVPGHSLIYEWYYFLESIIAYLIRKYIQVYIKHFPHLLF